MWYPFGISVISSYPDPCDVRCKKLILTYFCGTHIKILSHQKIQGRTRFWWRGLIKCLCDPDPQLAPRGPSNGWGTAISCCKPFTSCVPINKAGCSNLGGLTSMPNLTVIEIGVYRVKIFTRLGCFWVNIRISRISLEITLSKVGT